VRGRDGDRKSDLPVGKLSIIEIQQLRWDPRKNVGDLIVVIFY